jgi:uncharacterized protein
LLFVFACPAPLGSKEEFVVKIDVTDLLKSVGAELKINKIESLIFPADDAKDEDALVLTSPVQVKLKLTNTGETILVSGTVKTDIKLCCCRCLKDFKYPISIKIEEEYSKKSSAVRSKIKEVELKEKDFVFEIGGNNIIDLDEAIRQNLIVNVPIKPICSKTCKIEGVLANKGKSVDPRLLKLKNLKI